MFEEKPDLVKSFYLGGVEYGFVPDLDEIVSKIDAVNAEHVKEFAQNLCNSSVAYALYGPVKNAPDVSELEKRLVG